MLENFFLTCFKPFLGSFISWSLLGECKGAEMWPAIAIRSGDPRADMNSEVSSKTQLGCQPSCGHNTAGQSMGVSF